MRKIALVNQKGGVGKTTTAVNLSAALARLGGRVLLIDFDPQSNASVHLGALPPENDPATSYGVLSGKITAKEAAREVRPNLFLIPSSIELSGAELELASVIGREFVLRDAMAALDGFDFAFVDCPPSLGLLNVNTLAYVEEVFIPLQCEFFALQGISQLLKTVDLIQKRLNPSLKVGGVLPCMLDVRKSLSRETLEEIERHFGEKVFRTRIRANVRLAEAPSHGKTIFDYAPDSHGAADYLQLAREVLGLPPAPSPAPVPETVAEAIPAPVETIPSSVAPSSAP